MKRPNRTVLLAGTGSVEDMALALLVHFLVCVNYLSPCGHIRDDFYFIGWPEMARGLLSYGALSWG
jgi:hypothetical protein